MFEIRTLLCDLCLVRKIIPEHCTTSTSTYPWFCRMKRLKEYLLQFPLDGMLIHRRFTTSIEFAITHLYFCRQ